MIEPPVKTTDPAPEGQDIWERAVEAALRSDSRVARQAITYADDVRAAWIERFGSKSSRS